MAIQFKDLNCGKRFKIAKAKDSIESAEHIKLYEETEEWNACELSEGRLAFINEHTLVEPLT